MSDLTKKTQSRFDIKSFSVHNRYRFIVLVVLYGFFYAEAKPFAQATPSQYFRLELLRWFSSNQGNFTIATGGFGMHHWCGDEHLSINRRLLH